MTAAQEFARHRSSWSLAPRFIAAIVAGVIAVASSGARADDGAATPAGASTDNLGSPTSDPGGDPLRPPGASPWVAEPPIADPAPRGDHRLLAGAGLAGVYLSLGTWAYFAWYYDKPNLPAFKFGGDGYFGPKTYAGGADKLGHFWANLAFSRVTTDLLRRGGWGKFSSSALASGLCFTFFVFVEIKDGYFYEMSPGDLIGDGLGALASMALTNWPALDRAIDFRVQYTPSPAYRRRFPEDVDFAEDYSGQTYLLAWKPGSLAAVRDSKWLRPLRYIDPVIGYGTRNYKPPGATEPRKQELFIGVALDLQTVVDELMPHPRSRGARFAHLMLHGYAELGQLPYTSLPLLETTRSP